MDGQGSWRQTTMLSVAAFPGLPAPIEENPCSAKPRLIVDKLVLNNFKSYYGRHEIGPFHASFTSIVGPNGSGKSNIIDAFMFVLGYRAKKLRQSKLSELIHQSSSANHSTAGPIESCTVEVHFAQIRDSNDGGGEKAREERLVVARTAFRNNKNNYEVNGVASSFTEVTTLLKSFGIDLDHKRFLILQGEVESIALMKPKAANEHEEGLLEYLEDIIGSNRFHGPIEEAAKLVESFNESCAEKITRLRLAERDRNALAAEKAEAEEYIGQENQLSVKKSEWYQITRMQSTKALQRIERKIATAKKTLEHEQDGNQSAAAKLQELQAEYDRRSSGCKEIEKKASKLMDRLSVLEKADITLQESRKHIKNKIKSAGKCQIDEEKVRSDIERNMISIETEIASLGKELATLNISLADSEKELDKICEGLKGKTAGLQMELEKHQSELVPWQDKIRKATSSANIVQAELDILVKRQSADGDDLAQVEGQLESTENTLEESRAALSRISQLLKSRKDELLAAESELNDGALQKTRLDSEMVQLEDQLQQAEDTSKYSSSGNAILAALMKQASSGRIKGIHGRLGDLGTIDAKYDVAISTACASLNHIVVDTTAGGQACVEYLRTNNLGRASFIILEKLCSVDRKMQMPKGASRLFDLIKPRRSEYLAAFYYGLGDTLVAENMTQATEWAYGNKRFRVVTLDGKLIDTSGAVSGGGVSVAKGGMKASLHSECSSEELAKMRDVLAHLQTTRRALVIRLAELTKTIEALRADIKSLETAAAKEDMVIGSLPRHIKELEKRKKELKSKESKPSKEALLYMEELASQISSYNRTIASLQQSAEPIESAIGALQKQILDSGGIRLRAQSSKVDGLRERIETTSGRLGKLQAELQSLQKSKTEKGRRAGDKDGPNAETLQEQWKRLDADIEANTLEAISIRQEYDGLDELLSEEKTNNAELRKNIELLTKQLDKFRRFEFEAKSAMEEDELELEEHRKKASYYSTQLGQLSIQSLGEASSIVLSVYDDNELEDMSRDLDQLKDLIKRLEDGLTKNRPNMRVLEEYRHKEEAFQATLAEYAELESRRDAAKRAYDDLCKTRLDIFMDGFHAISQRLKEMYQLITMGGNAELELVDSLDPFSEGILFSVMPPKKSWKNISNLSGGEKTLSSLALVFALHCFKPTPIYVMDEIDAALDFRNVSIVANYIRERTVGAQFIVISLRNNMFELADRLVGVYKTDNKTKSIAIDPIALARKIHPYTA